MTFIEFRETPEYQKPNRWYIVTTERDEAFVLQWEPSNHKWYAPRPFWGREEIGYVNNVRKSDKVVHIRPLL